MHEYSLVESMLEQVDAIRVEQQAQSVTRIEVSVGEFAGVEPDLFRDAFEVLTDSTPAQGAELVMTTVPLEARCRRCDATFHVEQFQFECPQCHNGDIAILQGEDLILENVTLEQTEDQPHGVL